jgi:hypothetical protein
LAVTLAICVSRLASRLAMFALRVLKSAMTSASSGRSAGNWSIIASRASRSPLRASDQTSAAIACSDFAGTTAVAPG